MKIALVDPAAWSLAYDVPLAEALARAGCEVTLFTTRFAHGDMPMAAGVEVVEHFYRRTVPGLPRRVGRAAQHPLDVARLCRELRTRRVDVCHVQWLIAPTFDARAWSRLEQAMPVVFTAHNAQGRAEAVDPDHLRSFSAVVAHSDGGAATLQQAGIRNVWRMTIGPYGAYADLPLPDPLPVELPNGAPTAVLAGLLRPYKGVDTLLDAWPRVREQVPDAHLVIAGRPMGVTLPDDPPAGAIFLPRFLTESEYAWLLSRADAVCLPYRQIDMSGVAATALALGSPLVVTDVGGLGEYAGRGALVAPPDDPPALADLLVRVLRDPGLRDRMRADAEAAIRQHYSWDTIAADYVQRYKSLLDERPRRADT